MIVASAPPNYQQDNIDVLRALAVLSVFIHHAQVTFGGSVPFFGEYGGQFGPQLFFLISGYLIAASYARYEVREYVIHRLFRILPAYWFYMLVFGLWSGMLGWARISGHLPELLANATLLQHLFPESLIYFDILHVSWTLTVELLWYASLPLLLLIFKRVDIKLLVGSAVVSTVFALLASVGKLDFIFPKIIAQNVSFRYLFLNNQFIVQLPYFLIGAYVYYNRQRFSQVNSLGYVVAGLVIFLLKPYYLVFNPNVITGLGLACFLIAGISAKSINTKASAHLSETSYSVYLCHFPIILLVKEHGLQGGVGVVAAIFFTLLASTLSYHLIEKPGMRIGKAWGKKVRAARPLQDDGGSVDLKARAA